MVVVAGCLIVQNILDKISLLIEGRKHGKLYNKRSWNRQFKKNTRIKSRIFIEHEEKLVNTEYMTSLDWVLSNAGYEKYNRNYYNFCNIKKCKKGIDIYEWK